jgi:hypothetical protein
MKRLSSPVMVLAASLVTGAAAHAQPFAVTFSDVAYDSYSNAMSVTGGTQLNMPAFYYYEATAYGYLWEWDYALSAWEDVWNGEQLQFNGYDPGAIYTYNIPMSDLPNYGSPQAFMLQTNSWIVPQSKCPSGGYNDYYGFSLITPQNYTSGGDIYPTGTSTCTRAVRPGH